MSQIIKRKPKQDTKQAQSLLEYVALIALVAVVMVTMTTFVRRGAQGMVRVVADQIGNQEDSDQRFDESGHLMNSVTRSRADISKETRERAVSGGTVFNYIFADVIEAESETALNMGFTPNNR